MDNEQAGLLAGCIQGDENAIARLVETYQHGVFRLALSVLNDPGEANEAAQETFLAALKGLHSYRENATFKAWLYKIALNISRSRLRKKKALEQLQGTLTAIFRIQAQHPSSIEEEIINNEEEAILWKALERLGENHRIPILLRYYHDLSITEIAKILNIKEGTVHSRLSIARERLRSALDGSFRTQE